MKVSSSLAALALAGLLGSIAPANAGVFTFSFDNEDGPVAGTVSGTIDLPDGDGTFAATSVIVSAAPAALGFSYPFDVLANFTTVLENTFTVTGGVVDAGASHFTAFTSPPPGILGSALFLNSTPFGPGSGMNIQLSTSPFTGVIDSDNSTLTYSAVSDVPVPAPLAMALAGVGVFGATALRRRAKG